LFSWCPGRPIATKDLTLQQAAQLGVALARIHVASDSFVTTDSRYVLDERLLLERSLQQMRPALDLASPEDVDFIENCATEVANRLHVFDAGPGGWGIIHADPQTMNCHFTPEGAVNFFDFDHCGYGWRVYDIAYSLRHTNAVSTGEQIRAAVIEGYESVRSMSQAEHEMLVTIGQAAWIREGTAAGHGLPPKKLIRLLQDPYGPWNSW